ncbi:amidohydrolase [Paenibacillus sp.]|uniref:M20 metallopeptidase family protein n=1 Tax=Paenibacillus sp. TaxID=58172 RepID=UPI002D5F5F3A|nr:amidohydrolase [Paenibacillus sp.]HZG54948.1 amidohydrolase [Paenibacillus sp.]
MESIRQRTMDKVIAWRRHLHKYPEVSYSEKETAAFVARHLTEMGWRVRTGVGGHGVVADLDGGAGAGKRIALRADMDALPIQDQKTVEYASTVPGVMHACGHDGHTSALLGAAELLAESRASWTGAVRLLFQPAEELPPGGAQAMIRDGALDGVDEIYGIHLWSQFPACTVQTAPGPLMAASDEFTIRIFGKGGHGGLPHQAIDAVAIGSHLVVNLQTIVSRNTDPILPHVISVGAFHGGTTFNVIASECKLQGTVRTMTPESRLYVKERLEQVLETTCAMFGASFEIDYSFGYPPVVNHAEPTDRVRRLARERFGEDAVRVCQPLMAGEDFSFYLDRVPGCFLFVGAGNDDVTAPHHHPLFDIDERALETSVQLLYDLATKR